MTETRSTGCVKRRDAERWAGKLRAELEEGRYRESSRMSWADFRNLYEAEKDWQSDNTFRNWLFTADHVERIIKPKLLAMIDTAKIDRFIAVRFEEKAAVASVKGNLKYLRAALSWAKRRKIIHDVPQFTMPSGGDEARCRPITSEEFERILSKAGAKRSRTATEWEFYLCGLWWSGLRLDESIKLSWDSDTDFAIDMMGRYPMLRIRQGAQKSKRAELLPLSPEFAEMLHSVPEEDRTGFVFALPQTRPDAGARDYPGCKRPCGRCRCEGGR